MPERIQSELCNTCCGSSPDSEAAWFRAVLRGTLTIPHDPRFEPAIAQGPQGKSMGLFVVKK
jgi:hypothetical protein